jgi:predicted dehydrogenase
LWYSKVSLGHRNGLSIEVYGDKGSISWIQEDSEKLRFTDKFGNNNTIDRGNQNLRIANEFRYNRFKAGHPAGFIEAFANYYEDVFDELSATSPAKSEFIFRGQDSREGLKILEAVSKSSRDKAWVKIV